MINKVILLGNVGQDPEVRTLETGVKVARIRLATTERIFNRQTNETTEHTEWHTVTLWRGLAEVVDKYVRKGAQIYVEGRLRSRDWEKDGVKHYAVEVVADDMKLLGRRAESAPQGGYQQGAPSQYGQGGYQQTSVPSYQQSAPSPNYQQPAYQQSAPVPPPVQQPVSQPAPPVMAADDPDDLPF